MANRPDWLDGDGLLAKYRADPVHMGFFGIAEDDAAWGPWLDRTPPDDRQPIVVAVHGLSITYRKNRNITAARKWADIHLRLARSLPEGFGPRQGRLGLGRDRYIADALWGLARLEQINGSVERAHHLLLESERHLDAEEEVRKREGITERPVAERILGLGSVRPSLYESLAESAARLGLMDQARHYFDLWQGSRGEVPASGDQISELVQAADIHRGRGQPDAALLCLRRAVEIAEMENQDLSSITRSACHAYQSTARVYASLGTPRSALAMLEKAKALVDDQAEPTFPASIEVDTARILRDFPFLGDPLPHLLRALEHHSVPADAADKRSWRGPDGTLMRIVALDAALPVLLETAGILEGRRRLAESADFLHLATGIAEQVRNGALDETSRIAVQDQLSQAFIDLARVQLRLSAEPGADADGFADAAWQTVEALRARSFLDALGDVELPSPVDADPGLAAREAELLERRRALRLSPVRDDAFWTQQESADQELAAVWEEMAAASPKAAEYVTVRQARPASHAEVAELIAAGPGTSQAGRVVVMNMLFPDDEHLAVLAVDAASGHVRTVSSRVDQKNLTRFVTANFGEARRVRALAIDAEDMFHHELSGVIDPITDLCEPGDTLVICPAVPLHHVPLGAVHVGRGDDVLLSRNPLVFAPSASVLRSRQLSQKRSATDAHAVLGDPVGDLPHARDEAIGLAVSWGDVTPLLGSDATAEALLAALRAARTVHVAAHAMFDADTPLDSRVHMADRAVSAREVLRVRASALDLVTLSACESGIYHASRSEDPVGLTRALLFAGAGSVLASLWRVEDEPTQRVMKAFYDHLSDGVPKAEALRRASLSARDADPRPRLDRWAAFVLTGAWT